MPNSIRSWTALKRLIATPDLPGVGPTPRAGRLPLTELNRKVDCFIEEASLPSTLQPLVRSAALLWHDYLDESHSLSQDIHTADGSFLHGIMHRREPDQILVSTRRQTRLFSRHRPTNRALARNQKGKRVGSGPCASWGLGPVRVCGRVRGGGEPAFIRSPGPNTQGNSGNRV